MGWPVILLTIYCVLIAMSALFGGLLPSLLNLTHRRMQFLVSLIGGLMLGVAVFHQLPHGVAAMSGHGQSPAFALDWCVGWLMIGLLTTFFMLRMFHFHHHEAVVTDEDKDHLCGHDHDHDHDCLASHDHDHDSAGHQHIHHPSQGASWIGIFFGLAIHSLIDGGALAANVTADAMHSKDFAESVIWLLGFGTFLGVVLHKPLDSLSITTVMAAGGWSPRARHLVNVGYALMCPLGAVIFYLGLQQVSFQDSLLGAALAFSAGVFLCISLSDLLPEVQFHSHDRLRLSLALLVGVGLAFAIGYAEHGHMHGHQGGKPQVHEDHGHAH
ncbi:MAG: ZIP family metal transporter [Planctomycetes bacterium]|nr:ZIP family metal transporter [Planctomycetota bacterium]